MTETRVAPNHRGLPGGVGAAVVAVQEVPVAVLVHAPALAPGEDRRVAECLFHLKQDPRREVGQLPVVGFRGPENAVVVIAGDEDVRLELLQEVVARVNVGLDPLAALLLAGLAAEPSKIVVIPPWIRCCGFQ
jgi:hypothetical protein